MKFHCLFEQSGTFKNVFKAHGHSAYDYDVLDDYGQTDFKVDLFEQIEVAYERAIGNYDYKLNKIYNTVFDKMKPETDFVMAFFPCTYFTDLNELQFKLYSGSKHLPTTVENIKGVLKRNAERSNYYELFIKFCFVLQELGIRTIIENPAGMINRNYLTMYSPWTPDFIEHDGVGMVINSKNRHCSLPLISSCRSILCSMTRNITRWL